MLGNKTFPGMFVNISWLTKVMSDVLNASEYVLNSTNVEVLALQA